MPIPETSRVPVIVAALLVFGLISGLALPDPAVGQGAQNGSDLNVGRRRERIETQAALPLFCGGTVVSVVHQAQAVGEHRMAVVRVELDGADVMGPSLGIATGLGKRLCHGEVGE